MSRPRRTPRYIPFQKPTIPEDKKKKDDKKEEKKDKKDKDKKKEEEKRRKEEEKKRKEMEKRKKEEEEKRKREEEKLKKLEKKQKVEKEKKKKEPKKKKIEEKTKKEKVISKKKDTKKKIEKTKEPTEEKISQTCVIYTYPMERYQICLADTEGVMVAVMLESEPSEPIKQSLISFARAFSQKYKKQIDEFSGRVSDFNTAKIMVDDHFNLFLIKPIVLPLDPEIVKKANLTSEEKTAFKIATEISKDRGFFFTATLIDEVIKRTKIPRDKIVKAIFGLNSKNIFNAIDIEKVAELAERRKLWDQISENKELSFNDKNIILEDLLVSSEDSRKTFLEKIKKYPKKKLTEQIESDIASRKKIRSERMVLFDELDQAVKMDDIAKAAELLSKISILSSQLFENMVAKEFSDRANLFSQTAQEMRSRIPRLRAERQDIVNKANAMEVGGKYDEAAALFEHAAKISEEIGEMPESKKYLEHAERMKNLKELASLREALR
ncbi:MAG: hypothetical protein ACTSRG_18025 [Candidatus Helarchaeota archaeon]